MDGSVRTALTFRDAARQLLNVGAAKCYGVTYPRGASPSSQVGSSFGTEENSSFV